MKIKGQQSKFIKILTSPLRALSKARDFYVNRMNQYADRISYSDACGISPSEPFPRSFSVSSLRSSSGYEDDDLSELIRAASAAKQAKTTTESRSGVSRSASVGMAKIDEDKAVEQFHVENKGFDDKFRRNKMGSASRLPPLFPRSKSYDISSHRTRDATVC